MRYNKHFARLAALTLCFTAGTALCHLPNFNTSIHRAEIVLANINESQSAPETRSAPASPVTFAPVGGVSGFNVTRTAVLRERPDTHAPIITRLHLSEYEPVEILETTRDFLRVRFPANESTISGGERERDYEGWVTWGEVTPEMSAIVLDAESGALVARVPLGGETTSATFSPDGSRALFYGPYFSEAYEVRTSDYRLMRILRTDVQRESIAAVFYGGTDYSLHAATLRGTIYSGSELSMWHLNEATTTRAMPDAFPQAAAIIVSPDGSLGFIERVGRAEGRETMIEVVDLRTMRIRNSFTLYDVVSESYGIAVNENGSELYAQLSSEPNVILAIDTRTGNRLRELRLNINTNASNNEWARISDTVGNSLLISVWKSESDDHASVRRVWLSSDGGQFTADRRIARALQTNGARYAVNETGTRLFRLDTNNSIHGELQITLPELRTRQNLLAGDMMVYGLSASPDGRHIIMFIGLHHGC